MQKLQNVVCAGHLLSGGVVPTEARDICDVGDLQQLWWCVFFCGGGGVPDNMCTLVLKRRRSPKRMVPMKMEDEEEVGAACIY